MGDMVGSNKDSVTVMNKGLEMVLVRILTIFTSIDLSNNNFHGEIPRTVGDLPSLIVLNLSSNYFEGLISSFFWKNSSTTGKSHFSPIPQPFRKPTFGLNTTEYTIRHIWRILF
ncbi:LRR domain containing protein [Parasponia andersonii]|uniref:LRR domain containing protein n=1 Tax=Parasponia andersonii TaxID=3476 RepID=A0A2P5D1B1_PARAD|nr:LRR domain containing protein [Parasponia andersonii]